jgi:hypothetical protein
MLLAVIKLRHDSVSESSNQTASRWRFGDARWIYFRGIEGAEGQSAGKILLGDNTDGRAVMLRPNTFRCVESFGFFTGTLCDDHNYTQFRIAPQFWGRSYCLCRNVGVHVGMWHWTVFISCKIGVFLDAKFIFSRKYLQFQNIQVIRLELLFVKNKILHSQ